MQHGPRVRDHWMAPGQSRLWVWPVLAASLSLLTLSVLLWFAHKHDLKMHAQEFQSDLDSAVRSLSFRLHGMLEYQHLLAADIARGALESDEFQEEVAKHVLETPELTGIRWTNAALGVLWSAGSRQEGVSPAPGTVSAESARAVENAIRTGRSVYTGILPLPDGQHAVELYVPVFRDDSLLGVLGAAYSCEEILRQAVPHHVSHNNRVSLVGLDGTAVCMTDDETRIYRGLSRKVPVELLGDGTGIRLERHAADLFKAEMWLLTVLCVALTLGMACGMFALARYAVERQRAQEVLQRERDNLVNVLEAMEDGVAVVSTNLDVQYVNATLVKDFGPYEGRKCYEYFHGHDAPCSWCMMDDVIAGKTVHTEWCYPRNDRTYDLLDTRIVNPDGSLSKLKIFRDMTERVVAEEALRRSEQQFHELFERAADAIFLHGESGRIVGANQAACGSLGYRREEFADIALTEIYDERDAEGLRELLQGPALDAPTTVITRQKRRDGSTFPVEVRLSWLDYHRERLVLASARDITERERTEQAIQKRLEAEKAAAEQTRARLTESESLHRVSTALLEKVTLGEVLEVVCGEAQRLTRATGSGVLLLEDGEFRLTSWTGSPPPRTERLSSQGSFGGLAVERGVPLFIPDLSQHDLASYRDPRPGSLIVVPLRAGGKIIGVLDVAGGKHAFEPSDTRILSHFADQAAIAIEKARLREQAEQVAVLEERHRLARELHDSVTQSLYSASLYTDTAAMVSAAGRSEEAADHMRVVTSLVRQALVEMRLLIYELRPRVLEEGGLVDAIEARVGAVEERAGLEAVVSLEGKRVPLPAGVEEALYGIAHEALNNTLKHAKAKRVEVRVRFADSAVTVEVEDDGVGFDEGQALRAGGMGIKGMRERLERLGGRLVIRSAPNRGTTLVAEVAVAPEAEGRVLAWTSSRSGS